MKIWFQQKRLGVVQFLMELENWLNSILNELDVEYERKEEV